MNTNVEIPFYFEGKTTSKSKLGEALRDSIAEFQKTASFYRFISIFGIIILLLISIVCWLNLASYINIHDEPCKVLTNNTSQSVLVDKSDSNANTSMYCIGQPISDGWAVFGAWMNGIFATIALIAVGVLIYRLSKNKKEVYAGARKQVNEAMEYTRDIADKAIEQGIQRYDLKCDSGAEGVREGLINRIKGLLNSNLADAKERYLMNV